MWVLGFNSGDKHLDALLALDPHALPELTFDQAKIGQKVNFSLGNTLGGDHISGKDSGQHFSATISGKSDDVYGGVITLKDVQGVKSEEITSIPQFRTPGAMGWERFPPQISSK